jgi:alkylation response protein AidB-like acyl-CoA dehydrogenase
MNFQEISANIETALPYIKPYLPRLEVDCTLPRDLVTILKETGCFRLCMPKIWGGPELTSVEQLLIIEQLSKISSALGWCVMIGCDSGIYSGYLDDKVARELYPSLDMVQAGWVYPGGKAIEIAGGYTVTGQWTFGSGIKHADRIAAGCVVMEDGKPRLRSDGKPEWIVVIGTQDDFTIIDSWDTTGLRGTGSHDYYTKNCFFKKEHSFSFLDDAKREGLLWKQNDTFLRKMAGIPLGVCRNALDFVAIYVSERNDFNSQQPLKSLPHVQAKIAEAEMKYAAARAYLFESISQQWHQLEKNQPLNKHLRSHIWLSRLNVFRTTREIILELYDLVGGPAIRHEKTPLEQALRDSVTWCQHIVGKENGLAAAGNMLLNEVQSDGFPMI